MGDYNIINYHKIEDEKEEAFNTYKEIGIEFPRLRDCWLAKYRDEISEEELKEDLEDAKETELWQCVKSHWKMNPTEFLCSERVNKAFKKYSGKKDYFDNKKCKIRWDRIHGKKRKVLKYAIKRKHIEIINHYNMENKFAGNDNVLCVYTRLGASNWNYYECYKYEKQPWFLGMVEDTFDCTYCTIFVDINLAKNKS